MSEKISLDSSDCNCVFRVDELFSDLYSTDL